MAGDSATWLDLSIPLFIPADMPLVITVMSGQSLIGSAKFTYTEISASEMDNFGLQLLKSSLLSKDNEIMGRLVIKLELLHDEKINFSRLDEKYHVEKDNQATKKLKLTDMTAPMSSLITIPFVLKIEKVLAFDIIDRSSTIQKLIDNKLILNVTYDDLTKATVPVEQDSTSAVWTDTDWCWIVFDKEKKFNLMVTSKSYELGRIQLSVVDLTLSPKNKSGEIELHGFLKKGLHSIAKIILLMSTSPYVSPAEDAVSKKNSSDLLRSLKQQKIVGYMRIISVAVVDLQQVYAVFKNSPKVKLTFGNWTKTTGAAIDVGSNHIWENLDWGKVPIRETLSLSVKAYSGNELVGSVAIHWNELIKIFNENDGKNSILISADLYDGLILKGKFELVCLPVIDEIDGLVDFDSEDVVNEETDLSTEELVNEVTSLSLSTITPVRIEVKVLGISVYNLVSINSIYKNSPQVGMSSGFWNVKTNVAAFAGDSANWILKSNNLWVFTLKGMSFVKITVFSSGSVVGNVLISSREFVEVKRDSQGLSYIIRSIEKNDKITGNIKFCCFVKPHYFEDDIATKSADLMKKLLDNKLLLNNSLVIKIPFTICISQITALDFIPKNYFTLNFIFAEIQCDRFKKQTCNSSRPSGRYGDWSDLNWVFDVMDPTMVIKVSVLSGFSTLGIINITPNDILSLPRTSQGFTELTLTLKKDSSVSGKVQIVAYLTPYMSTEEKKTFLSREEQNLSSHLDNLPAIATLSIEVISAIDVSLLYPSATVTLTIGNWSSSTDSAPNKKETLIWGNLEWNTIPLFDRSNINVVIKSYGESLGEMNINCLDVINTPPDSTGFIVIHGDILQGLVSKGKLSIGCKIRLIGNAKALSNIISSGVIPSKEEKTNVFPYDFTKVLISSISSINLRPVHKVGKNSPSVKFEFNGFRFQSKSLPYAGTSAEWNDLNWNVELNRSIKIKLSVVSNSAIIGIVQFSSNDILLLTHSDDFRGSVVLEKEINYQDKVAGSIFIKFIFDKSKNQVEVVDVNRLLGSPGSNEAKYNIDDTELIESLLSKPIEKPQQLSFPHSSQVVEMDNVSLMSQSIHSKYQNLPSLESRRGDQLSARSNLSRPRTSRGDENDSSFSQTTYTSPTHTSPNISRTGASHESSSKLFSSSMEYKSQLLSDNGSYSQQSSSFNRLSNIHSSYSKSSLRSGSISDSRGIIESELQISKVPSLAKDVKIDNELYSYQDTETYSTSRSDYSDVSASSGWSYGTSEYNESSRPSTSSTRYSDYSYASKTSTASGTFLSEGVEDEVDESIKSNNDFLNVHNENIDIVEPVLFNFKGLNWFKSDETDGTIFHFMAREFVVTILKEVVSSLMVLEIGGDVDLSINLMRSENIDQMITSCLSLPDLIQQISVNFTMTILQKCFNKIIGQGKKEIHRNEKLESEVKVKYIQFPETNYRPFVPEFDPADPFLHELPNKKLIPIRVRMTVLDLMGLDLSNIDRRIFPKRPYLTACKPLGNWAAETGPAWTNIDNLLVEDMTINWFNLNGRWKWEPFILRVGQVLVFDLHDGGSGLLIAKARLPYEYIMSKALDLNGVLTIYAEFNIANEYGGGKLGSVIRFHADTTVNIYNRPKKNVEYWNKHRIHHWKHFPLAPISTGVVRQKYKEISEEYDKQKVIHPCFFGFKIRWRGNPEDESRFIHPMFVGFNLAKKPLLPKAASNLDRERGKSLTSVNPFRWDPLAAAAGRCLICTSGVPGCPRCFMLPILADGTASRLSDYAYNPTLEREKALELDKILIRKAARNARKMNNLKLSAETGEYEEGSIGSLAIIHQTSYKYYDENGILLRKADGIHTNLTNYQSIKAYCNLVSKLTVVYVKVLPAGYVKRFIVRSTDSVFHLYNMFNSHSHFGNSHTPMIILPTISGMFELHQELSHESDLLLADSRGRERLETFGFREKNGVLILLYFANYKPLYTASLLSSYFEKNINYKLNLLPTYDYIALLPKSPLSKDPVQMYLKTIIVEEYRLQQADLNLSFSQRGIAFRSSEEAQIERAIKKEKSLKSMNNQDKLSSTLRLEAQMKNFTPEQRKKALKALKKREKSKKRSALVDVEAGKKTKGRKKAKAVYPDEEVLPLNSSRVSLSDIKFGDSESESTEGTISNYGSDSESEDEDSESEEGNESDDSIESGKEKMIKYSSFDNYDISETQKVDVNNEVNSSDYEKVIDTHRSNTSEASLTNIVLSIVDDNRGSLFYIVDDAVSTNHSYSNQSASNTSTYDETTNTFSNSMSSYSQASGRSSASHSLMNSFRATDDNETIASSLERSTFISELDSLSTSNRGDVSLGLLSKSNSYLSQSTSYFTANSIDISGNDNSLYSTEGETMSVNSQISHVLSQSSSMASFDRKSDVTTEYRIMISPSLIGSFKQNFVSDNDGQSFGTIYSDLGPANLSTARSDSTQSSSYYSSSRPSTHRSENSKSTGGLYTYRSWVSGGSSQSDGWNSARSGYSSNSSGLYSSRSGFNTARTNRSEVDSRPTSRYTLTNSESSYFDSRPTTSSSFDSRPSSSSTYSYYSSRPSTSNSSEYSNDESRPSTGISSFDSRPSTSSSSVYSDSRLSTPTSERSYDEDDDEVDHDNNISLEEDENFSKNDSLYSSQINFFNDNASVSGNKSVPKENDSKSVETKSSSKLFTPSSSKKIFSGYGYIDDDKDVQEVEGTSISSTSTFQSSKVRRKISKMISDSVSISSIDTATGKSSLASTNSKMNDDSVSVSKSSFLSNSINKSSSSSVDRRTNACSSIGKRTNSYSSVDTSISKPKDESDRYSSSYFTYIHTYIYTYTHTYTHTYIHT